MALWYYLSNGQQAGPVERDALLQLFRAGQVSPADLVWCDGMPAWAPATSIPELAGLLPSPGVVAPLPPAYAQPMSGVPPISAGHVNYVMPYANASRPRNGTTAVGIISIIWGGLFFLCAGLAVVVVAGLPQSRTAALGPIDRVVPFASLALHGCLAASGIGTLMRKQWSKVLAWAVAAPLIGLYAYNAITLLSRHKPLATPQAEVGYHFGLFFTLLFGSCWLLFLIWFYQRPAVKQEFSSGR